MRNKKQKNQGFFSNASFIRNRKAQIAETMTWVVATVIIIIILTVAIFISTAYVGGGKNVVFFKKTDVLASKSFFSYLLTKNPEGESVYTQLKTEENLNDFNGNLGKKIRNFYIVREYASVWLGILLDRPPHGISNNYFGDRSPVGELVHDETGEVSEKIRLNEERFIEFRLVKEVTVVGKAK